MIQCESCKTMNPPENELCKQCNASLLPGLSGKERAKSLLFNIGLLIVGIVLLVGGLGVLITPIVDIDQQFFGGAKWLWVKIFGIGLLAFGALLAGAGVLSFLRPFLPSRLDEKYILRAKRHIGVDDQQAEADFNEAIRLNPKEAVHYYQRGLLLEKLDKLEQAERDYSQAITYSPKQKKYYLERGHVRVKLGKSRDARKDFLSALELIPDDDTHKMERAQIEYYYDQADNAVKPA